MSDVLRAAHSTASDAMQVAGELVQKLGPGAEVITFFFGPNHDGQALSSALRRAYPGAEVMGCSTAGEVSTGRITTGGVSAAALGKGLVRRRASAVARFDGQGVTEGIRRAVAELEAKLGQPLRTLDPQRHVGLIFIDSTHGTEEAAHVELGNAAPLLSFVGGSAGDDLAFRSTPVLAGEAMTTNGCALMVMELLRPHVIVKLCHFVPTETSFKVTRSDRRTLLALDGRPAAQVYAEYVGVREEDLDFVNLVQNPVGVVINGEPWVRQIVPPIKKNGAIFLGCEVVEGTTLHFLKSEGNIVSHFQGQMDALRQRLGGEIRGALMFDCALRRYELDTRKVTEAYARAIDFPAAGFNTQGESWLGHMHQTLTAIAFG